MTKAVRMMEEEIKLVDCVIYVLDARAPFSCINPVFDAVIGKKPRLYVINKCDLVEREDLTAWKNYFQHKGYPCVTANSAGKTDARDIVAGLISINIDAIEKYRSKGVNKTVRAMVIGVPNTGKSTLINSLSKEKKAATGNRPGVTRGKQWIAVDKYIELLDSPGVLYPDFNDQDKALRLALIGSIKDDVLDAGELALESVKLIDMLAPLAIDKRYAITRKENSTPLEVIDQIAAARGYILKGGETDYERTARSLITDFRKGYLGKITLEKAYD